MLEFQKIITSLILPPGIIIFLLLLSAYLFRKSCKLILMFNVALALLLWFFSIPVFSDRLIGLLENTSASSPPNKPIDSIILLGGGLYDGVPDISGTSAPTEDMHTRIVCAVRLYRQWRVPIIVSGGAPPEFKTPEAFVVRRFLLDMGIPAEHIVIEKESRDTMENAKKVANICKEKGYVKPVVVTSAYHARRASLAFKRASMDITLVASNYRSAANRHYGWVAFLPSAEPVETSWRAIREFIGLFYYSLVQ